MPIALTETEHALADAAAELCKRRATTAVTRQLLPKLAVGDLGPAWRDLVDQGLLTLHLPEDLGGGGAGLMELAVVAEQFGRHLMNGPWLPTVLASSLLAKSASDAARPWLEDFAEGAVGAVALDGLTAVEQDGGEFRVSGLSDPVPGLIDVDIVVARAQSANRPIWFVLTGADFKTVDTKPVDLTLSVARLELDWHHVPAEKVIELDEDRAALTMAALACAQAAGIASWAVDSAVEHLRSRHQFGKPLGAFQVLQHRAAMMLVRTEAAVAAAWDAARADQQVSSQWRLAAAQAFVTGPGPCLDVVFDYITMLGALGITWEHDAHLYQRKALALTAEFGPAKNWARALGEAALDRERSSRVDDPQVLSRLRADVGAVLDEFVAMPAEDDRHLDPWGRWTGGDRQRLLADARLIAPHLPEPYGRNAGPEEQAVIADEFASRGLSQPTLIVGDWALATLVAHGSDAQRDRFLGPSLRGELIWCQLFSEPEAGSDLASLRTRAVRVDGGWRLTGQKVWNSRACESHWGICLARTDPDAPKHQGLSYFLVEMSSEGVLARSIGQVNGQAELAEVFLDDVFVPDECLVGEPGDGWKLAVATLSNERLTMGAKLRYGSSRLARRLLDEDGRHAQTPDILAEIGEGVAREICLASMNLRTVLGRMTGRQMSAELSVNKVLNALAQRDGSRAIVGMVGPLGLEGDSPYVADYLGMPAMLFGGGTLEVQLNVIATRILKLPRG
ncbi:MAG: acyl-CoA dehydrogenase [Marmoricola sp.]|nr:acyl-CoA dehydrogenase [Marmoricola sp.]